MPHLNYDIDAYHNMHAHINKGENCDSEFQESLGNLLSMSAKLHCDLVWLKLSINNSGLIPVTVLLGFEFYYCVNDYLLLVFKNKENAILPPLPSHFVGVGGVVLDDNSNILVVREITEKRQGVFKLPGGNLENNEHFSDGIIREIYEETGIHTEFMWLSSIGHLKQWRLNKSNIYMVCRLRPLNIAIRVDPIEIAECKWMPLDKYLNSENVSGFNKHMVKSSIDRGMTLDVVDEYLVELKNQGFKGDKPSFELLSFQMEHQSIVE